MAKAKWLLVIAAGVLFVPRIVPRFLPSYIFGSPISAAPQVSPVSPTLQVPPKDYSLVAPFILDSVRGLLQQWPNSYAPNGHSIVAGTLPPALALYHAKSSRKPPGKPTFFAFDAEMSLGIYGAFGEHSIHVYSTTRTLNVIYFDGQSATLTPAGSLDAQMAVLQGKVPLRPSYDLVYDDDQRGRDLCDLVADLGIDGVVRMDAGFEVLICDYAKASLKELFITNITVPHNLEGEVGQDPNRQPPRGYGNVFAEQGSYGWLRSATWHYGGHSDGPSERRVHLDVCRMVSFYDPALTSLAGSHHSGVWGNATFQNGWGLRRGHRLLDIDRTDVDRVRSWLREITGKSGAVGCSGVDWHALVTTVQAYHGTRAREIAAMFTWAHDTPDAQHALITKIHELTHALLAPSLEYHVFNDSSAPKEQTISRCSSVYTAVISPDKLARPEVLLYHSVNAVLEKLCAWEWTLFEWSEKQTTNYFGDGGESMSQRVLDGEIARYGELTAETMQWIGWDAWMQCDRQCAANELCAIPTWPVIYAPGLPQGGIYAGTTPRLGEAGEYEFWRPKCINRTDFDRGGGRGREPFYQLPDIPPS